MGKNPLIWSFFLINSPYPPYQGKWEKALFAMEFNSSANPQDCLVSPKNINQWIASDLYKYPAVSCCAFSSASFWTGEWRGGFRSPLPRGQCSQNQTARRQQLSLRTNQYPRNCYGNSMSLGAQKDTLHIYLTSCGVLQRNPNRSCRYKWFLLDEMFATLWVVTLSGSE